MQRKSHAGTRSSAMASNAAASPSPRRSTFGGLDVMSMTVDPSAYCMKTGQRSWCNQRGGSISVPRCARCTAQCALDAQSRLYGCKNSYGCAHAAPTCRPSSTTKSRPRGANSSSSTAASGSDPDSWSAGRMLEHSSGRSSRSRTACAPQEGLELRISMQAGSSVRPAPPPVSCQAVIARPGDVQRGPAGATPGACSAAWAPGRWGPRACARRCCAASSPCPTGSPRTASAPPCRPA